MLSRVSRPYWHQLARWWLTQDNLVSLAYIPANDTPRLSLAILSWSYSVWLAFSEMVSITSVTAQGFADPSSLYLSFECIWMKTKTERRHSHTHPSLRQMGHPARCTYGFSTLRLTFGIRLPGTILVHILLFHHGQRVLGRKIVVS